MIKVKKCARCHLQGALFKGSLHTTARNAHICTVMCQNAHNGNGPASKYAGNTFVVNIWASGWHKILTLGSRRHQTSVSIQYIALNTTNQLNTKCQILDAKFVFILRCSDVLDVLTCEPADEMVLSGLS